MHVGNPAYANSFDCRCFKSCSEAKSVIYVGDYLALGLVVTLAMFFFDTRLLNTRSSKFFAACLVLTGCTALVDILTGQLLSSWNASLWLHMHGNTLYFVVNILTTSCFALYLFSKVLEHVYNDHCFRNGKIALTALFIIYMAFVISNYWNQWLFYFDNQGNYCRGPLNPIGYVVTVLQMCLVMVCYFRNRTSAGKALKRSLRQSFPAIILCILIQLTHQEIMLNGLIMAMTCLIIFLNFQGQRQGEHNLTKLNDRQFFYQDIERRIHAKQRFQVLRIIIRDFSMINQKYGYEVGDEVLYQCAFALEKLLPHVSAYHVGATDFALVMPYTSEAAAQNNLETLIRRADKGIVYRSENIIPDYIVVNCISNDSDTNVTEFCERLEFAAGIAKQQKKPYILCTPEMGEQMRHRRYLIERMQHPDREHGFQVWFQPVYCLRTGKFCSMEALLRLIEPDGTMIPPDEFISIAEQTGLIERITWFVAEEACRFLSSHPEITASVSINLPMSQLLDRQFESRLSDIVDHHGIAHRRICLEVTERAILEDFDTSKAIMHSMSEAGYRFFLDDFGTGYSNFSCLLQLPFTCIKLDRSLSQNISEDTSTLDMVHMLTMLFHNMGHEVIAEGAENTAQVNTLSAHAVDRIQGYYFARPMCQDDVVEFYHQTTCLTENTDACAE